MEPAWEILHAGKHYTAVGPVDVLRQVHPGRYRRALTHNSTYRVPCGWFRGISTIHELCAGVGILSNN